MIDEKKIVTRFDTEEEAFSRGFDIGNYAAAYKTEDFDVSAERIGGDEPFVAGHMLGFFSSYEIHEIPDQYAAEVEYFRGKYKEWL